MTAQKKETGRLTIKQRTTKPPLVQLSHSGRTFNLSKQQLSPVTEGEIRQTPSALHGTEVEFEFKDGQPWSVSRSGAKQVPSEKQCGTVSRQERLPSRHCSGPRPSSWLFLLFF